MINASQAHTLALQYSRMNFVLSIAEKYMRDAVEQGKTACTIVLYSITNREGVLDATDYLKRLGYECESRLENDGSLHWIIDWSDAPVDQTFIEAGLESTINCIKKEGDPDERFS